MVDLSGAVSQMVVLLLIAGAGFVAGKLRYIDAATRGKLTKILLNITLPCMIVASVGDPDAQSAHGQLGMAFALAAAQYFLFLAVGALGNTVLRAPKGQRPLYILMSTCSNNGFIGLPVIAAIYGNQTVLFSSIFIMVIALFFYSISFGILAKAGAEGSGAGSGSGAGRSGVSSQDGSPRGVLARVSAAIRGVPWKSVVNPSMVASFIAIALLLSGVRVPGVLEDAMGMLGSVTSPIAMMIVGALMSSVNLRAVVSEARIYPFILIRQVLAPLTLLFVLRALGVDEVLVAVFVIMFVMPVGSMAPTFAAQFGCDALLPAKGTVLSTIASFAIIPAFVAVMTLV